MSTNNDLTAALQPVDRVLRELGVAYYVGGSIASSYHEAARSTMDVDIVCERRSDQVDALVKLLDDEFYCSSSAILNGLGLRGISHFYSTLDAKPLNES